MNHTHPLQRLHAIREARVCAARWAPWLARLNVIQGLAVAQEGRACIEAAQRLVGAGAQLAACMHARVLWLARLSVTQGLAVAPLCR